MKITGKTASFVLLRSLLLISVYLFAYLVQFSNTTIAGLFLILSGIAAYVYFVNDREGNFLDFNAVFSGVWLTTVGLAQFRLLKYQVSWSGFTWLTLALAHAAFIEANRFAFFAYPRLKAKVKLKFHAMSGTSFKIEVKKERLYPIAIVASLVGIGSFAMNVAMKGYIPLLVIGSTSSAYFDFYTRWQIFIVASLSSVGLSYYCLRNLDLSRARKAVLWGNILVLNFILPILMVQRGTFLNSMLVLTAVVYLQSNQRKQRLRRFKQLVLCFVLLILVYLLGSNLRGFSNDQLSFLFQPNEADHCDLDVGDLPPDCVDDEGKPIVEDKFVISPQVSFLYSYLTVSHDNFNSIVVNKESDTLGVWQLKPFNVLLRNDTLARWIDAAEAQSRRHQVLPHLNSFNLISFAYYDFGLPGVLFLIALWSFCFGLIDRFHRDHQGVFSRIAYGICLIPVALGFFLPWMSDFVPWLYWGSTFLMFLASVLPIRTPSQDRIPDEKN